MQNCACCRFGFGVGYTEREQKGKCNGDGRKYSYYLLRKGYVEAGFDNRADPSAIRLKHGKIGRECANELIPHLHLANKTELLLTQEMTFSGFVESLRENA